MENETVKIDPKEFGLEKKSVETIEQAFSPKIIERDGLAKIYEQVIKKELSEETSDEAGGLRKKLVKVRTGIADIHRTQKAFFLAAGRFVDAWKNKETEPVIQMEENLSKIEKHFQLIEQKRVDDLQEKRAVELSKYVDDAYDRHLFGMDDDVWSAYLNTKKKDYEDRIEAEAEIERQRLVIIEAEKAEQKRIKEENERLRLAVEKAERLAAIEAEKRAKAEKERFAKEESERKIRQEKERKEKAEFETKLKVEREAKLKVEREAKAKQDALEAELKAKQESERKAEEQRLADIQADLNKGDAAKVQDLINDLTALKTKYTFKAVKNNKMYSQVGELLEKVINHIKQ